MKRVLWLALAAAVALAQTAPTARQIASRLTDNDLKADVSFLASDALEGRGTPSRGLDIAAEYIAAQFRRAGLEPAGDDGYFQTAAIEPFKPHKLRNVVGVLRGSDPSLKDTCLVISAHYDHLGMRAEGDDRIYNGADDDASGVATVIEAAAALAALPVSPKRSIVFLAVFGEEVGELGSQYYVQHPVFPAAKTIADVNLEQLGRTDDSEGPRIGQFNLTGFDYTTMAPVFRRAAEDAGVHAVNDERNSDVYFPRSDNITFAEAGIPSTTVSVAYIFPDYHEVGDEWPKLDYDNMAKVSSAIALAAFRLADSAEAPRWNPDNPKTARYIEARQAAR
jgi:Zn-dependent M28 family amino/carboxypeptidase